MFLTLSEYITGFSVDFILNLRSSNFPSSMDYEHFKSVGSI